LRLLLDTNVLIKLGTQDDILSATIKEAILNASEVLVTPIARAEIGIKLSIGKLELPTTESEYWKAVSIRLQASELPFDSTHAALLASLPLVHRDPFDRMIAAQCLVEDLHLATTDAVFKRYGIKVVD
jgi:PIN domain nuclease of toxin-antitoxin system